MYARGQPSDDATQLELVLCPLGTRTRTRTRLNFLLQTSLSTAAACSSHTQSAMPPASSTGAVLPALESILSSPQLLLDYTRLLLRTPPPPPPSTPPEVAPATEPLAVLLFLLDALVYLRRLSPYTASSTPLTTAATATLPHSEATPLQPNTSQHVEPSSTTLSDPSANVAGADALQTKGAQASAQALEAWEEWSEYIAEVVSPHCSRSAPAPAP